MKKIAEHSEKFYQNLGKLYYAIAMADKKVHGSEIIKLKEIVKKHWLPIDDLTDAFGTDAAYQIEIVFDWLLAEEVENDYLFEAFEVYFKNHLPQFTPKIKELIQETANSIAEAFSGKNKSELIILAKLKLLMK